MSHKKVSGIVAMTGTVLALAGSAYAEPGQNGPPGPEGNPNPPTAQPQANGPQGPAGNEQHGQSQAHANNKAKAKAAPKQNSRSKSNAKPAPKSNSNSKSKSKSKSNHANPNPGTPRKGGREDRPAGKITICHATRSETNPYVEITISVNGLNGHGPAADPHHHAGSWKDIIPAPAGGCPDAAQPTTGTTPEEKKTQETTTIAPVTDTETRPDLGLSAPAPQSQAVLGAQAEGTTPSKEGEGPASVVLGAQAEGETPVADAPAEVLAARDAGDEEGSLPFTGFELAFLLALGAVALLGGFALRRATRSSGL